jgi:OmcA/MtrC family decaheme c-type cytochrome
MGTPVPLAATGTYAFALEGYIQPGGAAGPRFAAANPIRFVAVTDASAEPRRVVVEQARCDACHAGSATAAHGGARNDVQYCPFCHNANQPGDERIARFESGLVTTPSLAFGHFMHRLHMGVGLSQQPYLVGGFPAPTKSNPEGTPIDFGQTRYPGDLRACGACHLAASYALPLAPGLLPSRIQLLSCVEDPFADGDDYCDMRSVAAETFLQPITAACTGCHDAPSAAAHAETNTSASGVEACETCHGPGSEYDVVAVHAVEP